LLALAEVDLGSGYQFGYLQAAMLGTWGCY